jgi:hypothetical protein
MGRVLPAPIGVMCCVKCLTVKAFHAGHTIDADSGLVTEWCEACANPGAQFMTFDPTPRKA